MLENLRKTAELSSRFSVGRDEGRAESGRTGLTKTTLFLSLATGLPNHSQRQGSYHRRYNPRGSGLGNFS